eukprot:SAG25_NODE_4608_length_782_cov_1.859444_1_plen_185_part_00
MAVAHSPPSVPPLPAAARTLAISACVSLHQGPRGEVGVSRGAAGAAAVSLPIRFCPARMLVPSCGAVSVPPPRSSPGAAAAAVKVLVAGGAGAAGGGAGGSSVAAVVALGVAAGVGGSRWGATVSLRRTSLSCPRPPVPSSAAVGGAGVAAAAVPCPVFGVALRHCGAVVTQPSSTSFSGDGSV